MKKILLYLLIPVLVAGCRNSENGKLIFVEGDAPKGFHHPYFLYLPDDISQNEQLALIVEPNNSGFANDDPEAHKAKARRIATKDFYTGNYVAQKLNIPLLVPVFPRPESDWKIYSHALDRDVMAQKNNPLERIDLQLLAMITDARDRLGKMNINTREQFLMTGFSASGTFANRFTLIHPDKVFAVAAGGLNGLLMLPVDSLQGLELNYPLGTGDFPAFLNSAFDAESFRNTPQFLFMGALDENDAIPYEDAFDQGERDLIYQLLGREMQPGRWNACKNLYLLENINATIKTYGDLGHEQPGHVKEDIVAFFRSALNGQ